MMLILKEAIVLLCCIKTTLNGTEGQLLEVMRLIISIFIFQQLSFFHFAQVSDL